MGNPAHLLLDSISLSIGGLDILLDVALRSNKCELLTLIGPNEIGRAHV